MCGIFGIVTGRAAAGRHTHGGSAAAAYRGYDSVGAATLHADGTIDLRKDVGKVEAVASRLELRRNDGPARHP